MGERRRDEPQPRRGVTGWLARVGLAALAAVLSVNLWSGAPLLAVWVGSRVQSGSTGLAMSTVGVVLAVLVAAVAVLLAALHRVSAAYDRLTGRRQERRAAPWLRSMRDERTELARRKRPLNALEKVLVASVVLVVGAFEVWFFFFSGSPIG